MTRPLAADDPNGPAADVKCIGEEFKQRLVGRSFNRRRCHSHDKFAVADTTEGCLFCAGNDADVNDDASGGVSKQF
jgi:hypothetical protein